jgi:ABC-type dipeptide/oligopeptide/nickel transport system permease component
MAIIVTKRILQSLFVIIGVTCVIFFILRLIPGDPALLIAPQATEAQLVEIRRSLGLDQPLLTQFWIFISHAAVGDFGRSYFWGDRSIPDLVIGRLGLTLQITGGAIVIATLVALPLGIIAGSRRNSLFDRVVMTVSVLFQSMPNFWVALMLLLFVAAQWRLLPAVDYVGLKSIILPSLALSLSLIAIQTRVVRINIIDVLQSEFIRAGRNRGLSETKLLFKYALKNVAVPMLTLIGGQFGYLLGGAIIIEFIFNYPGLGLLVLNAVGRRDYPLIQATVVVMSAVFIVLNLIIDLSYSYLDPRIRQMEE